MPVSVVNLDGITEIHTSERLEINLLSAKEIVENMRMRIWFNVETRLPNGKTVGQPYWDSQRILELSCEHDPELANAMRVIQQKIGEARYKQITTPPEISELVKNSEIMPSIENS
jgi:hypothetical protein